MLNCTTPGVWVEEIPTLPPSVAQVATVPDEPPTMVEATRGLGALGGHLGRPRDGQPDQVHPYAQDEKLCFVSRFEKPGREEALMP